MSQVLIHAAKVFDPSSPYHLREVDIFIEEGQIKEIGANLSHEVTHHIRVENLCVSIGWCDLRCVLSEPGFEHKDDFTSLSNSAAAGGFTDITVLPNTHPVIQSKESVHYVLNQSKIQLTDFHPIAALTQDTKGEQITEMLDLHHAGAKAFSDGIHPISTTAIMMLSLQYLQTFNGLLISLPENREISPNGQMHEGTTSTMMGTKGIPSLTEELAIIRDLELLNYTGGRLHIATISTAKGVQLIREAKQKGLRVTCDIAAQQVAFTDEDLMDFDTNLKVRPPFRSKADQTALWQGLADSTIDAIVSNHTPHDEESKKLEFDLADFGMLGLETAFAAIMSNCPTEISLEMILDKLTVQPRTLLGLPPLSIQENQTAKLTLFQPNQEWTADWKHFYSKSKNTPFVGKKLKGKVLGVVNGSQYFLAE